MLDTPVQKQFAIAGQACNDRLSAGWQTYHRIISVEIEWGRAVTGIYFPAR